ncbi:MAG: glycoside hydrolase family 99-like domain-containing protein, partial [Victivallales bacterium]|nr:glycoside hydrolase family 99-like domain-containing protein [Victivallales bacterium]
AAGIGVFIFDLYHYDDGPFLESALDKGFLGASNNTLMKFCNMWANHDWYDIHPAPPSERKLLYPGKVTRATFERIAELHIRRYFPHPSHFAIDGCPYFSIYELERLTASFGSVAETRRALEDFRTATKAAGFPGLHLNAIIWGQPILPGESTPQNPAKLAVDLGFDSVASYVWTHHCRLPQPQTPYPFVRDAYFKFWEKTVADCPVEYFPNVSVGWDTAPRTRPDAPCNGTGNYPYGPTVVGNAPEEFAKSLRMVKKRLASLAPRHPFLTINSWNEWTEGSYLEPDTVHQMSYLNAVRDAFPENVR